MSEQNNAPLGEKAEKFLVDRNSKKINICYDTAKIPHATHEGIEKMLHERAGRAEEELVNAFHAINDFPKSVTFFGSARFKPGHPYYEKAKSIGARVCSAGYAVITGGGPGIMAAGNEGSKKACNSAVGFNIELPFEQVINDHVTHGVNFHYFFTRKVALFFSAEAYVYFPGGFGTLDEFFELVTLIQTKKVPPVPTILVGSEYWTPVLDMCRSVLLEKFETISPEDMDLFKIVDDEDEIVEIIKNAPSRKEYE